MENGDEINRVFELIGEMLSGVWNNLLRPALDNLWDLFKIVFTNIRNIAGDVVGGLLKSLGGLLDFIIEIFTHDWKRAWSGINDIFLGIWNATIAIVEGGVNLVIDAINWMVNKANELVASINDVSPIKFPDIPNIPNISLPCISSISIHRTRNRGSDSSECRIHGHT